jgi:predicted acyl esterase
VEDPHYDEGLGPRDQRAIEARADVLTFTTPPLEEDVEVVGHIEFRLGSRRLRRTPTSSAA